MIEVKLVETSELLGDGNSEFIDADIYCNPEKGRWMDPSNSVLYGTQQIQYNCRLDPFSCHSSVYTRSLAHQAIEQAAVEPLVPIYYQQPDFDSLFVGRCRKPCAGIFGRKFASSTPVRATGEVWLRERGWYERYGCVFAALEEESPAQEISKIKKAGTMFSIFESSVLRSMFCTVMCNRTIAGGIKDSRSSFDDSSTKFCGGRKWRCGRARAGAKDSYSSSDKTVGQDSKQSST